MTKAKTTTTRRASEATEPKSATKAEVKPKRQRGTARAEAGRGPATRAAGIPDAQPTRTPVLDTSTGALRPERQTKAALLRARLAEPGGVSLAALMAATGWQAHTLRAALSGLRKEGLTLTRRREGEDTIYAIASGGVAPNTATADGTGAMGDAAADQPVAAGTPAPLDASHASHSGGTAA